MKQKKSAKARKMLSKSSIEQINSNAAGIDIGSDRHYVAVPAGRDPEGQDVRCFNAYTADLYELARWLKHCDIETIAMESTGVYWIPLFEILESKGFQVCLVNPRHVKNAPGRKTDVLDCQWLQQLHTFGLLQAAFRPEEQICQLRSYLRQRDMLIKHAAGHIQHMQKALDQMNIKLHQVVSDITGATGMRIVRAIVAGQRDAHELASLRDARCKNDITTIAKALKGNWRPEHLFSLKQATELYDFYQTQMAECDRQIQKHLETFDGQDPGAYPSNKKRHKCSHPFGFDASVYLKKMTGTDLTLIDGIQSTTALNIIGEVGLDMTRWPNEKHFSSWLSLCPGSKITGGKVLSSRSKASANRAAHYFRMAAYSLWRSRSALGAFLRRKKAHLGSPKAITATANKIARLFYRMLRYGLDYVDVGQDYYERRYQDRVFKNLKRNANKHGYVLVPIDKLSQVATT